MNIKDYKLYSMNVTHRDMYESSGGLLILAKREPTPQEAAKLWWDEDYDPETDTEKWIEIEEVGEIKVLGLNPEGTKCPCGADLSFTQEEVTGCGNCDLQ